jgi:predicted patatin/cPLA2 family phospholipase
MNINFDNFPGKFTKLILSGGGPRGLSLLGALHYITENNGLNYINEYWGTSIGSVVAFLLLIGYTPFEAFHEFFMSDSLVDTNNITLQTVLAESGFCPIELFGNKIRSLLHKKYGSIDPTFFDLYQITGKKLNIIGANLTLMQGECFNVDNTPLMKVIDALEISCDLPYLFTKKQYNNYTYVDGGFINNYPINMADNDIDYCLGICIMGSFTDTNSLSWLYKLLHLPILELHKIRLNNISDKVTHIELKVENVSLLQLSPDKKTKVELFSAGYKQARTILGDLEKNFKNKKMQYSDDIDDAGSDWDKFEPF